MLLSGSYAAFGYPRSEVYDDDGKDRCRMRKTETGSAGICITKRAINKVLRCRGHRQKSVSSFQARSCNLPLPPVRPPPSPRPLAPRWGTVGVHRQRCKPSQRGGERGGEV
ncbi:hypothetical protein PUN28_019261 [Cardiocondyla obscurior]|uniref:Uncharacterized protein n=1 Tax=Cardiocondyla obscurior TaxID=286306 RepID=A0AAW2EEF4_9HYME